MYEYAELWNSYTFHTWEGFGSTFSPLIGRSFDQEPFQPPHSPVSNSGWNGSSSSVLSHQWETWMGANVWPFSAHSLESEMWFKRVREKKKWGETGSEGREQITVRWKTWRQKTCLMRDISCALEILKPRISSLIKHRVNQWTKD